MATPEITRKYTGKDVEMLSACATIIEQATIHKTTLVSKRANWADPFLPNLQTRIDGAFANYLGIDNAKQMRAATQVILNLQETALELLAEFKVQIEEDFKTDTVRRDEVLTQLGFTAHHKNAQSRDQEALIQLLLQFNLNMTNDLKTEITAKGLALQTITDIITQADVLNNANITQETLKGGRKDITQEALTEFNGIYNEAISVARISAKFFKKDPAIKNKFSYSKTIKALNKPKPTKPDVPPIKPDLPPTPTQ